MKKGWIGLGLLLLWTLPLMAQVPDIEVTGTMKWQGERTAYIDAEMVRAGDVVKGFRVLEVKDNGVRGVHVASGTEYYIAIGLPAQRMAGRTEDVKQSPVTEPSSTEKSREREAYVTTVQRAEPAEEKEQAPKLPKGVTASLILALLVMGVGFLTSFIGNVWFLVEAFKENLWWGFGCLFLPFVSPVFLFMHWEVAGKPFGLSLLGSILAAGAVFAAPQVAMMLR